MAYDRYDSRGGRDRRPETRYSSDYDRDRQRSRGGDDRGFLERAGDEISSWFGDEDAERRRDRDMRMDDREPRRDRGDHRSAFSRGGRPGDRDYRPMTGDYGREGVYARDPYRDTSYAGSSAPNDPHYHEWRRRQVEQLDRDYDDYRRENQSRFEDDFGSWRSRRDEKRQLLGQVRDHMDVVGSDGEHVGTVDCVKGDRIVLTRSDPESGGLHHSFGCSAVDRIEGDRVVLDMSADKARARWRDEGRSRALFERDDEREDGPHMLDRSFSGTYR